LKQHLLPVVPHTEKAPVQQKDENVNFEKRGGASPSKSKQLHGGVPENNENNVVR